MSWFPWGLSAVFALAGFAGIAYYRWRWIGARDSYETLADAADQWKVQNDLQAKRLADATAALTARQEKERTDDQTIAKQSSGDVGVASDLLNKLHHDAPSSGSSDAPGVPPGSSPRVSGFAKPPLR